MNQILNLVINLRNNAAPGLTGLLGVITNLIRRLNLAKIAMGALNLGFKAFRGTVGLATAALKSFAGQLILLSGIQAGGEGFTKLVNELDQLGKTAQRLNITTDSLSGLKVAAQFSGVEFNNLNIALREFNTRIEQARRGNQTIAKDFERIGVSFNSGKPLNELLLEASDGLNGIASASERSAIALNLFGKAGPRTLQFLTAGADAINVYVREAEKFGAIVSDELALKASAVVDSLTRIQLAIQGILNKLGQESFVRIAQAFNNLAELIRQNADKIVQVVENVVKFILRLITFNLSLAAGIYEAIFGGGQYAEFLTKVLRAVGGLLASVSSLVIVYGEKLARDLFSAFLKEISFQVSSSFAALDTQIGETTLGLIPETYRQGFETAKRFSSAIETATSFQVRLNESTDDFEIAQSQALKGARDNFEQLATLFAENPIYQRIFSGEMGDFLRQLFDDIETGSEDATDSIRTFGDVGKSVGQGLTDAFTQLNEQFNTISGLAKEVSGIVVGGFNAIRSSAVSAVESVLDGSASAGDAFKEFGRSIIRTLINMAAQFLVLIPILILFNVLSGAPLATAGAAAVKGALGSIGGLGGGLAGVGGGAAAGAASSAQSVPIASSSLQAGSQAGGGSMIVINTLDSADLESYLSRPRNAEAVASALGTRGGSPTFRNAVAGAL